MGTGSFYPEKKNPKFFSGLKVLVPIVATITTPEPTHVCKYQSTPLPWGVKPASHTKNEINLRHSVSDLYGFFLFLQRIHINIIILIICQRISKPGLYISIKKQVYTG